MKKTRKRLSVVGGPHTFFFIGIFVGASTTPGFAIRLLADTNLRHACIARGEFTRNLTLNNLALLPEELTLRLGPVATKALLVSWRYERDRDANFNL